MSVVFLRLLEYYKGVMFLTTNRLSTFDAAFQSRIHLMINYPRLDVQSKKSIWQTFIRPHSETSRYAGEIKQKELDTLARLDMNGREIKNTVKTARLLANHKGDHLTMEHVSTVLRVKQGVRGEMEASNTLTWLRYPLTLLQSLIAIFVRR